MYTYTLEYVQELRRKCRRKNMWAPAAFWMESGEYLKNCYNGIGPECWSTRFREWVTKALDRFSTAALIHDYEYSYSAGKCYRNFTAANFRFAVNSIAEAWHSRASIKHKLIMIFSGWVLAFLCQVFGWKAYEDGK